MRAFIPLAAILIGGAVALGQPVQGPAAPEELLSLARELRVAMYYAALAVYAPTPADRRLYAQQVVNLIEGREGEHFATRPPGNPPPPGMLVRLKAIEGTLLPQIPAGKRRAARLILINVRIFLGFALHEALDALHSDDMDIGAEHMRKAFAFLNAAWGAEVETPYLGGVWLLLHLGRPQRMSGKAQP